MNRTPTFVCEVPLRVGVRRALILDTRLEAARQVCNACLGKALKRGKLMRDRRRYRTALSLPKGDERSGLFHAVRAAVEFNDAALQRYGENPGEVAVVPLRTPWRSPGAAQHVG